MSHDWDVIQNALHAYVVGGSQLDASRVRWAQQDAPRSDEPGIVMRLSIFDDVGMPWVDTETNYLTFDDITVTSVDAGANTLTSVGHELVTGDGPVRLVGADLPLNLLAATDYWVIVIDDDTIQLAAKFIDAMALVPVPIDLGDVGSGSIVLVDTTTTFRAGQEISYLARSTVRASLSLECFTYDGVGANMATSILNRIRARSALPSQRAILEAANIGLSGFDRIFALMGTRDAFLFEPRASVNVQLVLASEDSETGTIIERVELTREAPEPVITTTVDGAG